MHCRGHRQLIFLWGHQWFTAAHSLKHTGNETGLFLIHQAQHYKGRMHIHTREKTQRMAVAILLASLMAEFIVSWEECYFFLTSRSPLFQQQKANKLSGLYLLWCIKTHPAAQRTTVYPFCTDGQTCTTKRLRCSGSDLEVKLSVAWGLSLETDLYILMTLYCSFSVCLQALPLVSICPACCICLLAYTMGHQHGGCGHQVAPLRTTWIPEGLF